LLHVVGSLGAVHKVSFLVSSESSSPSGWELLCESDLPDNDGRLQSETLSVSRDPAGASEARFIKVVIKSGFEDFATVHQVAVIEA
jgi:hypothetical protein